MLFRCLSLGFSQLISSGLPPYIDERIPIHSLVPQLPLSTFVPVVPVCLDVIFMPIISYLIVHTHSLDRCFPLSQPNCQT